MTSALSDLEDKDLLRRHVEGDPEAFGELFRRHRDRMWAVATRVLHDRDLAADCVQEAFISAFRHAGNYRGDAAVTTWLHRITVNACMDRVRRDRHVVRRAGDLAELDLVDEQDHHGTTETVLDVREALAALPEPQRLALVLVDMHGMSVAEAAQVLQVAEGTVKSRCFRGRAALAEILRPRDTARRVAPSGPTGSTSSIGSTGSGGRTGSRLAEGSADAQAGGRPGTLVPSAASDTMERTVPEPKDARRTGSAPTDAPAPEPFPNRNPPPDPDPATSAGRPREEDS